MAPVNTITLSRFMINLQQMKYKSKLTTINLLRLPSILFWPLKAFCEAIISYYNGLSFFDKTLINLVFDKLQNESLTTTQYQDVCKWKKMAHFWHVQSNYKRSLLPSSRLMFGKLRKYVEHKLTTYKYLDRLVNKVLK